MTETPPPYDARVPATRTPKGGKHRLAPADRQRQAIDLRREGASYDAIARTLGYADRGGAYKAVQRGLRSALRESAEELRTLVNERLDAALAAVWPRVLIGDDSAILSMLRIEARRARMLGLDAPTKLSGKVSGEVMLRAMTEQAAIEAGLDPALVLAEAERILDEFEP